MVRSKTSCTVRKKKDKMPHPAAIKDNNFVDLTEPEVDLSAELKRTVSDELFKQKRRSIRRSIATKQKRRISELDCDKAEPTSPVQKRHSPPKNLSGSDTDDPSRDAAPHCLVGAAEHNIVRTYERHAPAVLETAADAYAGRY